MLKKITSKCERNVPTVLSSRTSTSYRDKCAVENCGGRAQYNLNLSFHLFPRPNESIVYLMNDSGQVEKMDKAKAWRKATCIKNLKTKTKVCSLHFKKEDYILPDVPTKRRVLKRNAVPSCHLPKNSQYDQLFLFKKKPKERPDPLMTPAPSVHTDVPPTDTHFVIVQPPPAERNCDDPVEPYKCYQCPFTAKLKVVLDKHEQSIHDSTGKSHSKEFQISQFTCNSCQKCATFSAVIMLKHHASDCPLRNESTKT